MIPSKVIGKFSIRIVPNQKPHVVQQQVIDYLNATFKGYGSPNKLNVYSEHGAEGFGGDPFDFNYTAASQANEVVYGVKPDMVRSGGSIPVTLTMQDTGRSVVLFPVGRGDDGAHGPNEKIDINQFINGIKLVGVYMEELGKGIPLCKPTVDPTVAGRILRPPWAKSQWGMCGNMAEGQCLCCF